MELGTCGSDVKELQKKLNKYIGQKRLPENGEFDEGTEHYLRVVQKNLGVPVTGKADKKTLKALDWALLPRTKVTINGKTAEVTKIEYIALKHAAAAEAAKDLRKFLVMATEVERYWKFHNDLNGQHWFSGVVEWRAGAKFPPKSEYEAAKKAANAMIADALAGKAFNVKERAKPIDKAVRNMQAYRTKLFEGGDKLIGELEAVRDTCEVTVSILAAVSTGGASWYVTVGVNASVGAYKGVMGELRRAKNETVTAEDIKSAAMKAAAIEAAVGVVMKGGGKGAEGFMDDIAKAAADKATGQMKGKAAKYATDAAIKFANGYGQKKVEQEVKDYFTKKWDPQKKESKEQTAKNVSESVVNGFLKVIAPGVEKYSGGVSRKVKLDDVLETGDKARQAEMLKNGADKLLEEVGNKSVEETLKNWDGKKDPKKFEAEVHAKIAKDPKVKRFVKDFDKKQQAKGKSKAVA